MHDILEGLKALGIFRIQELYNKTSFDTRTLNTMKKGPPSPSSIVFLKEFIELLGKVVKILTAMDGMDEDKLNKNLEKHSDIFKSTFISKKKKNFLEEAEKVQAKIEELQELLEELEGIFDADKTPLFTEEEETTEKESDGTEIETREERKLRFLQTESNASRTLPKSA